MLATLEPVTITIQPEFAITFAVLIAANFVVTIIDWYLGYRKSKQESSVEGKWGYFV